MLRMTSLHLTCRVGSLKVQSVVLKYFFYVNDMSNSVDCNLLLYGEDFCLVLTGPDVKKIEANLNRNFNSLCDWFLKNKLSIHFGEEKAKSISRKKS